MIRSKETNAVNLSYTHHPSDKISDLIDKFTSKVHISSLFDTKSPLSESAF